jgi:hypothetical protein
MTIRINIIRDIPRKGDLWYIVKNVGEEMMKMQNSVTNAVLR